ERIVKSRVWSQGSPVVPVPQRAGGACGCGSEKEKDVLPTAVPVRAALEVCFVAGGAGSFRRPCSLANAASAGPSRGQSRSANACPAGETARAGFQRQCGSLEPRYGADIPGA